MIKIMSIAILLLWSLCIHTEQTVPNLSSDTDLTIFKQKMYTISRIIYQLVKINTGVYITLNGTSSYILLANYPSKDFPLSKKFIFTEASLNIGGGVGLIWHGLKGLTRQYEQDSITDLFKFLEDKKT